MATPPIDKDGGFVMPAGIAKVFAEKLILQPSLLEIMKKAKMAKEKTSLYSGKNTFTQHHWSLLQAHGVKSVNVGHDVVHNLYNLTYSMEMGYIGKIGFTPEFIQECGEKGVVETICKEIDEKFIKSNPIDPLDAVVKEMSNKMAQQLDKELMDTIHSENQVTVAHGYLTYPDPVVDTKSSGPLTDQVDTLQYQMHQRPGTMRRDMSHVSCRLVAAATKDYYEKWNDKMAKPEHDAISFYLMNHGVAEIASRVTLEETLEPFYVQLFNTYHETLADAGLRLFYYLLLICTRETRHINDANNIKVFAEVKEHFDDELLYFVRHLPDDSMDAAQAFMHMKTDAPIGRYCDLMCYLFDNGKWSSSFGGKKWGVVADALNKYVHGVYSLQLLLDVGFALAHNGGPIFNKYMLYDSYNGQWLRTILDCQRAGQIPQFVNSSPHNTFVTDKHTTTALLLQSALGDCMMGDVDWQVVKDAGAIGKYDDLIKMQPPPTIMGVDLSKDAPESLKKAAKDYMGNKHLKGEPVVTHFQVMPDVNVPIMKG